MKLFQSFLTMLAFVFTLALSPVLAQDIQPASDVPTAEQPVNQVDCDDDNRDQDGDGNDDDRSDCDDDGKT